MLHWYPLGVPWTTLGLFLCTLSYDKRLVMGLVSDPNLVPDVWDVVEDLNASYQELLAAAADRGRVHQAPLTPRAGVREQAREPHGGDGSVEKTAKAS